MNTKRYDGSQGAQLKGYRIERVVEWQTPEGYGICWQEQVFFEQAVLTYRDEWIVEHGFHRFKGVT